MRDLSPQTADVPQRDRQTPGYLTTRHQRELGVIGWWYRIASPSVPGETATFQERERFRRGRTGSQILPALYLLLIVSVLAGFVGTNASLPVIVVIGLIALVIATFLNRMGMVNMAGFIVVVTFIGYPIANILTTPGGLGMLVLPEYGLLVLPLVCAVSFLPPWWVFIVAVVNTIFTLLSLSPSINQAQTAELATLLTTSFAGVVTPIILSQLIVAVVAFLWVRSTVEALMRADRAEELAKLEHDLALQAEIAAQQKQGLELSIQQIVETHRRVANGDYNARVPITSDNVLWPIAGSLNNLLSRVQRWRQDAAEVQQMKFAIQQMREENRRLTRNLRE
jgi:HAMP domain-containing protein